MSFLKAHLLHHDGASSWHGPRRWWGGPLDVEGLALASVQLCATAIEQLASPSRPITVESERVASAFNSLEHLRIDGKKTKGFAILSGFFPTADGWIRTHANYPHHANKLCLALGATSPDGVASTLSEMTALEAESGICATGGIASAVRTRQHWSTSPMAAAGSKDWIKFDLSPSTNEKSAGRRWTVADDPKRPLAGLRVLDFTRVIAGPTASRTLALWGADVLRVDPLEIPELQEQYIDTGFGKRSTSIDLADAVGALKIRTLLEGADVVLLGYRHGSLDRFGLSPLDLRERYPQLVIVTLDAWGEAGPWRDRRGFDSIVQAAVGIADLYRDEDDRPGALPVQALDHTTGYGMAAAAISLVATRMRENITGTARLSLVQTADALFDAQLPTTPVRSIADPELATALSFYGELVYVQPPFSIEASAVNYPGPPRRYGSDDPHWL